MAEDKFGGFNIGFKSRDHTRNYQKNYNKN